MLNFRRMLILSVSAIITMSIGSTVTYAEATVPKITYIDSGSTAMIERGWTQSDAIILVGWGFADELAVSPFAMIKDIPIFTTDDDKNLDIPRSSSNLDAITKLGAKTVYIIGGIGAVSQATEDLLKSKGFEVIRLSGATRFNTAKAIGDQIVSVKNSHTVFLSSSEDYADASTCSTFAGQLSAPILLTGVNTLNPITQAAIKEYDVKTVYITGGTGVISKSIEDKLKSQGIAVTRLGGKNRYETAKTIIKYFKPDAKALTLVDDHYFSDIIAGAVYGYKINQPVMIINKTVEDSIKQFVWACTDLTIIGNAITDSTIIPSTAPAIKYPTDPREAKVFVTPDDKLVTVNKDVDFATNMSRLNGMIGNTYGVWYRPTMTNNGFNDGYAKFIQDDATNIYGLNIFGWRGTKDSGINENNPLNAVLETFYFLCRDKAVSYALWEWIDANSIQNKSIDSSEFGFTDVKVISKTQGTIKMNDTLIDVTIGDKNMTLYFK